MKIKIFNYTISIIKNKKRYRKRKYKSKDDRPRVWTPPSALGAPRPKKGLRKKITGKLRRGWSLVKPTKYQATKYPTVDEGRFKGYIGVGGLVLAKISEKRLGLL
jgi:hypothetical protein